MLILPMIIILTRVSTNSKDEMGRTVTSLNSKDIHFVCGLPESAQILTSKSMITPVQAGFRPCAR